MLGPSLSACGGAASAEGFVQPWQSAPFMFCWACCMVAAFWVRREAGSKYFVQRRGWRLPGRRRLSRIVAPARPGGH